MTRLMSGLFLVLATNLMPVATAQDDRLTVDRIVDGKEFRAPSATARFIEGWDGYFATESSRATSGGKDIVRYDFESGRREVVVPAAHLIPANESAPLEISGYEFSEDRSKLLIFTNTKRVWRYNTRGDYWVLDRASRELRKVGGDAAPSTLMFAKFSPDGRRVAYVIAGDIYLEDLGEGTVTQLTDGGASNVISGTFDWVYEEEFGLRDGFRWSPDGKHIAFWEVDASKVGRFPLINNTDSLYPKLTWIPYPKVGTTNPNARVGIMDVASKHVNWLPFEGDSAEHYIARMDWHPEYPVVFLQRLNRLQNKMNFYAASPAGSPQLVPLFTELDKAWVNVHDELQWVDENDRGFEFFWVSERSGWRHIYQRENHVMRPVTKGKFDVVELLDWNADTGWLHFIASPDNATQRYLYRIRKDGSEFSRVTPEDQPGDHSYRISHDGKWAIHTWSNFSTPPTTELIQLSSHKTQRVLADPSGLTRRLQSMNLGETDFLKVPIGEDVSVDAYRIRPPGFDPKKKYPLLVYVYGEPAGQTVRDRWGGNTYLWHQLMAQRGIVVMSFDNHGTPAPKGREWRKSVYRKIGVIAPEDQAAAVRSVLQSDQSLDADRVGVWGWSGGGSMTLNAMFKFPDLYRAGVSVAPVANQRYYDTIYQERYMGIPSDNVEGFTKGSPINFAHQLKGNLLLIHGTGDDNCHYQATEALINELVRHNKQFSMMAYPNRSHSIREGTNTRRHLRKLMTNFFEANLVQPNDR